MATYPIKMLKDEENTPFVPLTSTEGIQSPSGQTLDQILQTKLGPTNLHGGLNTTVRTEGYDCYIDVQFPSGLNLINNLTTTSSNQGALDAYQGKVLNDKIPVINNTLTSTSTTQGLSAAQGKVLNDKFGNYLLKNGGTMTGVLKFSNSIFSGTDQPVVSLGTAGGIGASTGGDALGMYGTNSLYLGQTGSNRIVITGGSLKPDAGTWDLGASSKKWNNVYANTFTGTLSGNATSATKATQDGSGNTITSTYATKKSICGATYAGSSDKTITVSTSWGHSKYTNFSNFTTSNSSIFSVSGGGIKVSEAGYYIAYSTVNTDLGESGASGFVWVNDVAQEVHDVGKPHGMVNMDSSVQIFNVSANTVFYAGYRIELTGNYLTRGQRSMLTVIRVG